MSVADGEIVRATLQAILADGTIVQNRKTFMMSAAAPVSDVNVRNAIKTWVDTLYAFLGTEIPVGTEMEPADITIVVWNGTAGQWETDRNLGTYTPLDAFANASEQLPNQCSAFCVANTVLPKSKGRIFAYPFGEDRQDHGVLIAASLANLVLFAAQYITDQPIGGDELLSGVVREAADVFLGFTTVQANDVIGTQRRRRFGVGI